MRDSPPAMSDPPPPAATSGPPSGREPSRRTVVLLLALLVAAGLLLRLAEFRFGLPYPLHSDHIQVKQAAQLLRGGSFLERSPYPATHTWAYAAADVVAYGLDRVFGFAGWADWDAFVTDLQSSAVQHAIGRAYTAFTGAWLAVAVYLLARVRFPRGTALLAAAVVACCPAFVIYSHQARVHVPGITLLAFAAVPVLRLALDEPPAAGRAALRRALLAGAGAGAVAAVFQLGFVLLAAGGLLLLCFTRPFPRMVREGALVLAAFAAVFFGISSVAAWPGIVGRPPGEELLQDAATLGIPASVMGMYFTERFPALVANYVLCEPVRVACLLLFLLACWRGRHRWRDALAYGCYPVLLLLLLGTNYTNVRYSMSATVFLAPLAAAGALALRPAWARAGLAALLVLAPLASSVRFDLLLRTPDTRCALDAMLRGFGTMQTRVSVESSLVLGTEGLPRNVVQFPPLGNFKPWAFQRATPPMTLKESNAGIFVRVPSHNFDGRLNADVLAALGYRRCAVVDSGNGDFSYLPDAPPDLVVDIWRSRGPGPSMEFWSRDEAAAAILLRRAQEHGLDARAP
jgi:hypothetical protein